MALHATGNCPNRPFSRENRDLELDERWVIASKPEMVPCKLGLLKVSGPGFAAARRRIGANQGRRRSVEDEEERDCEEKGEEKDCTKIELRRKKVFFWFVGEGHFVFAEGV